MYTDAAMAGIRLQTAYAVSAGKLLGPRYLPLFAVGTDLLFPCSANRDLRRSLWLPDSDAADAQLHLDALDHGCRETEVSVPQLLGSAAFLANRPGAAFRLRGAAEGGGEGGFVGSLGEDQPRQLVLRPRFGCQFYSEVRLGERTGGRGEGEGEGGRIAGSWFRGSLLSLLLIPLRGDASSLETCGAGATRSVDRKQIPKLAKEIWPGHSSGAVRRHDGDLALVRRGLRGGAPGYAGCGTYRWSTPSTVHDQLSTLRPRSRGSEMALYLGVPLPAPVDAQWMAALCWRVGRSILPPDACVCLPIEPVSIPVGGAWSSASYHLSSVESSSCIRDTFGARTFLRRSLLVDATVFRRPFTARFNIQDQSTSVSPYHSSEGVDAAVVSVRRSKTK